MTIEEINKQYQGRMRLITFTTNAIHQNLNEEQFNIVKWCLELLKTPIAMDYKKVNLIMDKIEAGCNLNQLKALV